MYMYVMCTFLLYEHTCMCVLTSRLGKAGGGAVDVPFAVSVCMALFALYLETITNLIFLPNFQVAAINLNYCDSGLFGIYTVCDGSATEKVSLILDLYLSCILNRQTYSVP